MISHLGQVLTSKWWGWISMPPFILVKRCGPASAMPTLRYYLVNSVIRKNAISWTFLIIYLMEFKYTQWNMLFFSDQAILSKESMYASYHGLIDYLLDIQMLRYIELPNLHIPLWYHQLSPLYEAFFLHSKYC